MMFLLDAVLGGPTLNDFGNRVLLGPILLVAALFFSEISYYSYTTRVVTFLSLSWFSISSLPDAKVSNPAIAYVTGVASIWLCIWSLVVLVVHDPPRDLKRIWIHEVQGPKSENTKSFVYRWEGVPKKLSVERAIWAVEMVFNMRGLGWNYTKPPAHAPDKVAILYSLNSKDQINKIATEGTRAKPAEAIKQPPTKVSFLLQRSLIFLLDYVVIDIITYFTDQEPFLQGREPAQFNSLTSLLQLQLRLLLAGASLAFVIDIQFQFISLICVGLVGPKWLGTFGEPYMHPSVWGSPLALYHRGLLGFWGTFWHPLFKLGFQETGNWLIPPPNPTPTPNPKSSTSYFSLRSIMRLHLVFALSGIMHAAGSWVTPGTTPWHSFLAFFFQANAIVLQELVRAGLKKLGARKVVQKLGVLVFVLGWSLLTMPLLVGDMAVAKYWHAKALPFCIIGCGSDGHPGLDFLGVSS